MSGPRWWTRHVRSPGATAAVLIPADEAESLAQAVAIAAPRSPRDGRVAECRLVPFDQAEFDDIWTVRNRE